MGRRPRTPRREDVPPPASPAIRPATTAAWGAILSGSHPERVLDSVCGTPLVRSKGLGIIRLFSRARGHD
jgi:hypothetical protein